VIGRPRLPEIGLVPVVHAVLAAMLTLVGALVVASIVAVTGRTNAENDPHGLVDAFGTMGVWALILILLPLVGAVLLGIRDWQAGRGALVIRSADVAGLVFAGLLVRGEGTTWWWLAIGIAAAAVAGLVASATTPAPQRDGWRF
jgi:hypothetical protein